MTTLDYDTTSFTIPTPSPSPVPLSPVSSASSPASSTSIKPRQPKRVPCARCRKLKEKCVWEQVDGPCVRCGIKGIVCTGPTHKTNKTKQTPTQPISDAPVTRSAPYSPHHTSAGRPRILGPTSSEASLNAVFRAKALRTELIGLYHHVWPVQPMGIEPSAIHDLINGPKDEASKVMIAICTATGARSSSNSEIVQTIGPPLELVDHPTSVQPPGGFAEWGIRRRAACVALGNKAIDQATTFFRGKPTFRMLTVALVASGLSSTLYGDLSGRRTFNTMAVKIWRAVLADPVTTEEERALLLGPIGRILVGRDLEYTIACGGPTAVLPSEQALTLANNPFDSTLDCFGIPDCANANGLVIFDEVVLQSNYQTFQLWLLNALASLVTAQALANFTSASAQTLRQLWAVNEWANAQTLNRLAQIKRLSPDKVIVLHKWHGRWRPNNARDHAACLVSEMVADGHDLDSFVYSRLQTELDAGTFSSTEVDVKKLVDDARERCRMSLRDNARAVRQWMVLDHRHALLSRVFHYLGNIHGWVGLALGRFGESNGPRTKEAELSLEDVESLVWGLRVGSFSQGSLVTPLRELEQGLEQLTRAEVVNAGSKLDAVDFDLNQFVVGLDFDEEPPLAIADATQGEGIWKGDDILV